MFWKGEQRCWEYQRLVASHDTHELEKAFFCDFVSKVIVVAMK